MYIRDVAQLAEHSLWERGVAGSSPVIPTDVKSPYGQRDKVNNETVGYGRLAQLVRASRLHRECRGFESLSDHL